MEPPSEQANHIPAPAAHEDTGLDSLQSDLQAELDALTTELELGKSKVEGAAKQKSQAQSTLTQVQKALDTYKASRNDAATALQASSEARDATRGIIHTLAQVDVDRLQADIDAIDQQYEGQVEARDEAQEALAGYLQDMRELEAEIARSKEGVDKAYAALSRLAAEIKSLIAPLKTQVRELTAATNSGQALKAYVLSSEMDAVVTKLEKLTVDNAVNERTSYYKNALDELSTASDGLADKTALLAEKTAAVTAAQAALVKGESERKKKLAELYVLPKPAPSE